MTPYGACSHSAVKVCPYQGPILIRVSAKDIPRVGIAFVPSESKGGEFKNSPACTLAWEFNQEWHNSRSEIVCQVLWVERYDEIASVA